MGDEMTESLTAPPSSRPLPFREDCWSQEATATLVDAWGRRFMELNRGNLRHKDWQDVADAVNALHGHTKKGRRTDVQCKNRIDTLKKKYKTEKAKIAVESKGTLTSSSSSWPFFSRLDFLIGKGNSVTVNVKQQQHHHHNQFPRVSPSLMATPSSTLPLPLPLPSPLLLSLPSPPMGVPLPYRWPTPTPAVAQPAVLPQKRPSPSTDDSYFKRNYSAMAAAAAAEDKEAKDEEIIEESEEEEEMEASEDENGIRRLAKAIERFGAIYERVEGMKRRQMIELEKQRMEFAKDLELQRMQLFMDTQVQLEKIKQAKRPSSDDIYS